MKMSPPYAPLFITTMGLGTLLTLSATNWISVWVALEINLMSFIPLMMMNKTNQFVEASIKYFIIQAIGSIIILITASTKLPGLIFALMMKMGAAPLHLWFPSIMSALPWSSIALLSTWQKVAPLMLLLSTFQYSPQLALVIGTLGAWAGAMGAMNQTKMKPMMAFSSISNTGWIMALLPWQMMSFTVFMIYCMNSLPLMIMLNKSNLNLIKSVKMTQANKSIMLIILISLASFPMTPGFLSKWIAMNTLMNPYLTWTLPLILLISALPMMYVYLNIMFMTSFSREETTKTSNFCSSFLSLFIISMVMIQTVFTLT